LAPVFQEFQCVNKNEILNNQMQIGRQAAIKQLLNQIRGCEIGADPFCFDKSVEVSNVRAQL